MQADPDHLARLNPAIPARNAAVEMVKTASLCDAHDGKSGTCIANCVAKSVANQASRKPP
jgi:hypothetical protein